MEHLQNNMPSEIFDWMNNGSFELLDEAQKAFVLQHMTASEFNELAANAATIRRGISQGHSIRHAEIKRDLLKQFHRQNQTTFFSWHAMNNSPIWRSAAVLLIFFSGWIGHRIINSGPTPTTPFTIITDTVYINAEQLKALRGPGDSIAMPAKDTPQVLMRFFERKRLKGPFCKYPRLLPDNLHGEKSTLNDTFSAVYPRPSSHFRNESEVIHC